MNPIEAQAAEWSVRLGTAALSSQEEEALDDWLEADARHRGALLRAQAIWVNADRLAGLSPPSKFQESVLDSAAKVSAQSAAFLCTPSRGVLGSRAARMSLIAACLAMITVIGAVAWRLHARTNVYVARVGEIRRVTLSDGSRIVLNTASQAAVHYDAHTREVELQAGEGLFQVEKDPMRPFIVHVRGVNVRAVGTVFAVRSSDDRVDVTVTEGVVEVIDRTSTGRSLTRLIAANEHATVTQTRQIGISQVSTEDTKRQLAWREGMVDFAGESLSAAAEEVNRHNQRHIVIDDPVLARRPVVGVFRANDPEGFAATIATALGGQSVEAEDAIHVRRRTVR